MKDTLNLVERERRAYPGGIYTVLVPASATNNRIFMAEVESIPGSEPPRHVHEREDEIAILKEGKITFFVGHEIIHAEAGDTVFLPKNIPHHFIITSDYARTILITTPGDFEHFFKARSVIYDGIEIPETEIPTQAYIDKMERLMVAYGLHHVFM
jgi:quercetin dioxygenase-like cupin family protein